MFKKDFINFFQNNIIEWGFENFRSFPWRREDRSEYMVLFSEIFLQRTSAKQVLKIYDRFFTKFPNIDALSKANEFELEEIIKSLGLYRRRINVLNKISKQIKNEFNSVIPDNYKELISLFGVGQYIANAVLCFAFGEKVPIVDINVIRIFQRFFGFHSKKKYIEDDPIIWQFAKDLLPKKDFQKYNYSLLDFGQIICKSKNPLCKNCVLNSKCIYINGWIQFT